MFNNKWLFFILGITVGIGCYCLYNYNSSKAAKSTTESLPVIASTTINTDTNLSVKPKENPEEPDLVVTNNYVANINGKTVTAPMTTTKDNTTATVSTTIDVTPLVKQMMPRWEAGVGVGYDRENRQVVYPIAIQRNYKQDKAIECLFAVDNKGNFRSGYLVHKWKF